LFLDCFCEIDTFKLFFDFANFTIKKTTGNNLAKLFFEETIEKKMKKTTPRRGALYARRLSRHRHFSSIPIATILFKFPIHVNTA
jgi:hypothetical protein